MKLKPSEKSPVGWYFLALVIMFYTLVFLVNSAAIIPSLIFCLSIVQQIIPIFALIFVLLAAINYFIKPKTIVKYLGKEAGIKGWLISIAGGILSHGPIYMWYPLLSELQKHKVRSSYIAAFLYNRAIKIPLLPLFVYYFGLVYVVVLTAVMIIASVLQGIIVERIVEVKK